MNQSKDSQTRIGKKTRAILVERFPKAFAPKGSPKLPLRVGVHVDLQRACPDLKKWDIHRALADYAEGPRYWSALVEGARRVDLDGTPCEPVTAGTAAWARKKIAEFRFPLPPELQAPAPTTQVAE